MMKKKAEVAKRLRVIARESRYSRLLMNMVLMCPEKTVIPHSIFCLHDKVLAQIKGTLRLYETGGILGASIDATNTVTAFHFDSTGRTEHSTYTPDVGNLNRVIAEWAEEGIEFVGFVHSHPKEDCKLSKPDIEYADKIKEVCSLPQVLMVIYLPDTEAIYPYVI